MSTYKISGLRYKIIKRKGGKIMKKVFLVYLIVFISLVVGYTITRAERQDRLIDEVRKNIQIQDIEMTEDGILVTLNVNGENDLYYWEDQVPEGIEIIEE